ncbi:MAG: type III polyketide synthase [Alphaproteobacteria bacterium]|nr:type III polyketide synthase [Alphaproteobacteria bacterium]
MTQAFSRAGIDQRAACFPLEWYLEQRGWRDRMAAFEAQAQALLLEAGRAALAEAQIEGANIDAVVCVSTTGVSTPSLDSYLIEPLGLRPDVSRTPIFGLGCAGGVNGLSRASDLARALAAAQGAATVLLLVVELCTLTFRPQDDSKANLIGAALFGDGAAAMVLRSGDGPQEGAKARQLGGYDHIFPASHDIMGWTIEEDGFGVLFSRDIPKLVENSLPPVFERFLDRFGLAPGALRGAIAHPGGAKVLEAYRRALPFNADTYAESEDMLRRHGNTSAVTVLSVLKQVLATGERSGLQAMMALGPGFSAGFGLLDFGDAA